MQTMMFIAIYAFGVFLCYTMQRIEIDAKKQTYTKGDRALNILFSSLSFLWIAIIIIIAWIKQISATGYWAQPVKPEVTDTENKKTTE